MVAGTIPIKTPAGQAELSTRARRLSQRHRTVLFLVDGRRSTAEVRSLAAQAGAAPACFDELLAMGLIMLPERAGSTHPDGPDGPPSVFHLDLPLQAPDSASMSIDSLLPAARTLYPTVSSDSSLGELPSAEAWGGAGGGGVMDEVVAQARLILLRAVRAEAPLAGSLTLLRLRRARTREDLAELLAEVESRISKPHRALAAAQTMLRVRLLLEGPVDSSLEPA